MKKIKALQLSVDIRIEEGVSTVELSYDHAITALEALITEIKKAQKEGRNTAALGFISGIEIVGEAEVVLETFSQDGEDEADLEEYHRIIEEAPTAVLK